MHESCLRISYCRDHFRTGLWENNTVITEIARCPGCTWQCYQCQDFIRREGSRFEEMMLQKGCTNCVEDRKACTKPSGEFVCKRCSRPRQRSTRRAPGGPQPPCDWLRDYPDHSPHQGPVSNRQAPSDVPVSAPQALDDTVMADVVLQPHAASSSADPHNSAPTGKEGIQFWSALGSGCLRVETCSDHRGHSLWSDNALNESVIFCQSCIWPCPYCQSLFQDVRLRNMFISELQSKCVSCRRKGYQCVKLPGTRGCRSCLKVFGTTCDWYDIVRPFHFVGTGSTNQTEFHHCGTSALAVESADNNPLVAGTADNAEHATAVQRDATPGAIRTFLEEPYQRGTPIVVTRERDKWGSCEFDELDSHNVSRESLREKYDKADTLFYAPATFFRIKHCPRLPNQHLDPDCSDRESWQTESEFYPRTSEIVHPTTEIGNWKHRSSGWYMSTPSQRREKSRVIEAPKHYSDEAQYYKPSHYILEAPFPNENDIRNGPWRATYRLRLHGQPSDVALEHWTSDRRPEGPENKFVHTVIERHSVVTARRVCSVDAGLTIRSVPRGTYQLVWFLQLFTYKNDTGVRMPDWMPNKENPFAVPNNGTGVGSRSPRYPGSSLGLRLLWGRAPAQGDDYEKRWSRAGASHSNSEDVLRMLWGSDGTSAEVCERHIAVQLTFWESSDHSCSYGAPTIESRGWHMVRAPGKAIQIDEDHADLFFLMEKFHPEWHGGFRFGGIGLLNVRETPRGVWRVGPTN